MEMITQHKMVNPKYYEILDNMRSYAPKEEKIENPCMELEKIGEHLGDSVYYSTMVKSGELSVLRKSNDECYTGLVYLNHSTGKTTLKDGSPVPPTKRKPPTITFIVGSKNFEEAVPLVEKYKLKQLYKKFGV